MSRWNHPTQRRTPTARDECPCDPMTDPAHQQGGPVIHRILFTIRSFIRSRDGSTPERPRKDGSYGWPRRSPKELTDD